MIEQLSHPSTRLYSLTDASNSFDHFQKLCENECRQEDYPNTISVEKNIPIYDLSTFSPTDDGSITSTLQDEWYNILHTGPGVFVLKNFYPFPSLLDEVNTVFASIIESEAEEAALTTTTKKGDHFAASGKNARIWNSFQKHALASPDTFTSYYANPWLALVSSAWLGMGYRVTAQVNIVRPGGAPQVVHRDYHLGFQTPDSCAQIPRGMQTASQFLTLQGAIAHSDMSLESGPTRFLPFSQRLDQGYLAYRLAEYRTYFDEHWVSLPLAQGDAVFFNPALFHAAGHNRTTHLDRSANLLQISSPFGRAMESVNTIAIVHACWDSVVAKYEQEGMSLAVRALVAAFANGYPFPTNLDRRPPAPGGMAPESEADVCFRALKDCWSKDVILQALTQLQQDSLA